MKMEKSREFKVSGAIKANISPIQMFRHTERIGRFIVEQLVKRMDDGKVDAC
jgi:hypothetical protein